MRTECGRPADARTPRVQAEDPQVDAAVRSRGRVRADVGRPVRGRRLRLRDRVRAQRLEQHPPPHRVHDLQRPHRPRSRPLG